MNGRSATIYIALVQEPERGTYEYVYKSTARNRQEAEDAAREAVARWGGTLVRFTPALDRGTQTGRRLLVIAASTLIAGGAMIATAMIAGLALEGAL
jgi:hypothetical protein